MITEIDAKLLEKIADLTGKPVGAFNIRKDSGCEARQSTEHIDILPREDGKSGIDVKFKPGTKGEKCYIPVIISKTGVSELVFNDFYVPDDCDVEIVAGCGIHNSGCDESRHDGVHTFHIGKNARVRYSEKHYGENDPGQTGGNVMNPKTVVYLGENASMQMDTVQIRGIDSTKRETDFFCEAGSEVVVTERLLTHGSQTAESDMNIQLNGRDAKGRVISRSVAQDQSHQVFRPVMVGNAQCFGHVQCDSIIMGQAKIESVPAITANCPDAQLIHDDVLGTDRHAAAAGQALLLVDDGVVVDHMDGVSGTVLLTQMAADARAGALLAGIDALFLVGTEGHHAVGLQAGADDMPGALPDARTAVDALVLVDLGHAVFIQGDGLEFAYVHAQLAADAAVLALCRGAAAAIAGDKGRLIGEAFFDSHLTFPSFHTACWQAGALCGAHRHSGNRRRQWRARWGSM